MVFVYSSLEINSVNRNSTFKIAVFPGDGIGIEVMGAAIEVLKAAEQRFGGFALDTDETLVRRWDVDGLAVRPAHRMVAHTAFLTTARRVRHRDDGGPPRPIRKNPRVTWPTPTDDGGPADED